MYSNRIILEARDELFCKLILSKTVNLCGCAYSKLLCKRVASINTYQSTDTSQQEPPRLYCMTKVGSKLVLRVLLLLCLIFITFSKDEEKIESSPTVFTSYKTTKQRGISDAVSGVTSLLDIGIVLLLTSCLPQHSTYNT